MKPYRTDALSLGAPPAQPPPNGRFAFLRAWRCEHREALTYKLPEVSIRWEVHELYRRHPFSEHPKALAFEGVRYVPYRTQNRFFLETRVFCGECLCWVDFSAEQGFSPDAPEVGQDRARVLEEWEVISSKSIGGVARVGWRRQFARIWLRKGVPLPEPTTLLTFHHINIFGRWKAVATYPAP